MVVLEARVGLIDEAIISIDYGHFKNHSGGHQDPERGHRQTSWVALAGVI
jgi:hypothetical protein